MTKALDILAEPMGDDYRHMLEALLAVSSKAIVVVRHGGHLNGRGAARLEDLRRCVVEEREQAEWPGTKLLSGAAQVFYMNFDATALDVLSKSVDGLYRWRHPDAPEDICLLRTDESPVLTTIAHEEDGVVELRDAELGVIRRESAWWRRFVRFPVGLTDVD